MSEVDDLLDDLGLEDEGEIPEVEMGEEEEEGTTETDDSLDGLFGDNEEEEAEVSKPQRKKASKKKAAKKAALERRKAAETAKASKKKASKKAASKPATPVDPPASEAPKPRRKKATRKAAPRASGNDVLAGLQDELTSLSSDIGSKAELAQTQSELKAARETHKKLVQFQKKIDKATAQQEATVERLEERLASLKES